MKNPILFSLVFGLIITSCGQKDLSLLNASEESNLLASKLNSGSRAAFSTKNNQVGTLIPVADMQTPRAAHTATRLNDGSVLICGGFEGSNTKRLSSAEIYDPASKSFTKTARLTTPRIAHSSSLMSGGKVLIAGGYDGNALSTTEIYDPESKTFSKGPDLNTPRYGHTATLLPDGKILIAGGVGPGWTFLSSVEIYDFQTNEFIPVKDMALARESHTATLLKNGNVLITGGHRDRRENLKVYASAEIYDSKSNQFSPTGSMNIPRHKHDAVLLSDGKVLVNGGADKRDSPYASAEIYDPITAQFTSISDMNYPRYKHQETSILLPDNTVLIGGGSDRAEVFNYKTAKFTPIQGNLGTTRLFSRATQLDNGEVLITGSYDDRIIARSESWLFAKHKP
ncbi:Kelch repeat-containing protein [Pararhodonellum marinum]|uniref:Kelch repeat-containing protein n=1 Tax=Pararhodonellum marinum TaxID=2755358 RepID=UPI00188DC92D|nr:kelch repeat-containing protein [Pararhodonellum marinum]